MMIKGNRVYVIAIFLVLASLACSLVARPAPPTATPLPPPTEVVESLEGTLDQALQQAQSDEQIVMVVTEAQLTALVARELQTQGEQTIQDPQVLLRDGQVKVSGKVSLEGISASASIILTVKINSDGQPHPEIVSARLGLFPIPDHIVEDMEISFKQAFIDQFESMAPNTRLDSITIADGLMTVVGRLR